MCRTLLTILVLLSTSYSQAFFKFGYGSLGYRLGLESSFGNLYMPKYVYLYAEAQDKDTQGTFSYVINSTSFQNLTYKYYTIYLNLGFSIPTQLWGVYLSPFIKARYINFKLENNTQVAWNLGGGISLSLYLKITKALLIVPQAYIYYLPDRTFYYKNQEVTTVGKDTFQKGFALDIDLGF